MFILKTIKMELQIAIEKLKEAKNVQDWNRIRENIKTQVSSDKWMSEFVPAIDSSGLIVEVLGQD